MSVRIELSGFSLKQLQSLSSSNDQDALKVLSLMARDRFTEKAMNADLNSIIVRAITKGFPFKELEKESDVHVTAASLLADYKQKHLGTDSNVWAARGLWDLADKSGNTPATSLLKFLAYGRPLFGKHIVADPQTYAFLSLSEMQTLRKFLPEPVTYKYQPPVSNNASGYLEIGACDDFAVALATWLKALDEKKMDLWLFQT